MKKINRVSFYVGQDEYIVEFEKEIDVDKVIKELNDELNYQKGFFRIGY